MTLHRSQTDIGWIKRRFTDLDRRIEQMSAARRLESANIGKGGLTVKGGDIFLKEDDGSITWRASEDPIRTRGAWNYADSLAIPATWTVLGYATALAPAGFIGEGNVSVNVSCGDTMSSGSGSVSVQPTFRYRFTDGSASSWIATPALAVASPENRIAVASSFWSYTFPMADIQGHEAQSVAAIELGANCVRSFGTEDAGTGNWHVAAQVIFKRGGAV